jgi:hypothetical protein
MREWQSAPFLEAKHTFLEPIANLQSLRHCLEQLSRQVSRPLADQFLMAGALEITIAFDDGQAITRRRTLGEPIVNPKSLLTHVDALIAHISWGAPVERVTLAAQGLCPTMGRQLELFRKEHEAQEGVEATLRRIKAKFGPSVVQQGHMLDPNAPLPEQRAYLAPWEAA